MSFLSKLAASFPPQTWQNVTVLVAVSGGADSVAMLRGLAELRVFSSEGRLIAAHFNHHLRGAESDGDEAFVRELAQGLNIPLEVGSSGAPTGSMGDGIEAAARAARYEFLNATARRIGARYVVTAHTSGDQVETVLHRILRGTGISGLAGIPKARELTAGISLLRPLLSVSRAEVLSFLASLQQSFREDSSNASLEFARNQLRRELLPLLEREYAPKIRSALLRLSQIAAANQDLLTSLVEPLLAQVQRRSNSVVLDCASLAPLHSHLLREFLVRLWSAEGWPQQDMSFDKWSQLATLIQQPDAPAGAQILPGGITAEKIGAELRLSPPSC